MEMFGKFLANFWQLADFCLFISIPDKKILPMINRMVKQGCTLSKRTTAGKTDS